MIIDVVMKSPDVLQDSIEEAVSLHMAPCGGPPDELLQFDMEQEADRIKKMCEKWFKWGETVTLTIDTEKETCEVKV